MQYHLLYNVPVGLLVDDLEPCDVKSSQSGFLFGTLDPNDLSFFRIPFTEATQSTGGMKVFPVGQGYYIKRKFIRVKGAIPYNQWNKERWVKEICDRWHVVV
ncbi:hypothetical protein [Paenibacillus sp. IHBB 10380]|uniref:hypothetical protein n=1 Tax=Paenibacillus sp. IHBB 10380 TaxID=1566358 RepID=UPI0005CF936C|nr:hypothetical protein [Paenibacillus sp. IHBB 10380]AJS59065.1 hypothetical protein UB51_12035 [Paenibacillus sp. IHBB 10380]